MDQSTEDVLLSAWSHPLLTRLTNPDAPPSPPQAPSDPLPVQLEEEVVVVLAEGELEEAVIGRPTSTVGREASAVGDDERAENEEDR